ncbi:MAG: hypothetical protein EOM91_12455 [Sphingobacteriia bacterium]|nr:hypothetical protein [Sphingobacteriia bacterium]
MKPIWSIKVGATDITEQLARYLLSISVTDGSGTDADTVAIEIADPRAIVAWPEHGAELIIGMGYDHTGLTALGSFFVDEVRICNPPRVISIRGNSADLQSDALKQRKRIHYKDETVRTLVEKLAAEMGLTAAIHPDLARRPVPTFERVAESAMNAVTRLARRFDAVATVKTGHLTFVPAGAGETASGAPIPDVLIREENCTRWCFEMVDRGKYTAAKARYRDFAAAKDVWVEAGTDATVDSSATYELRQTYPDRESAQEAARGKIRSLVRNAGGADVTHIGDPTIGAQAPLILDGFGDGIDGRWIADEVTHRIDGSGFVTTIRAKLPAEGR